MSKGRSPSRPARKQPYKPLPGSGPSELHMTAQDTIQEIRRSRVVGSVTEKQRKKSLRQKQRRIRSVVTIEVPKELTLTLMDIVANTAHMPKKEKLNNQLKTMMIPYQSCLR